MSGLLTVIRRAFGRGTPHHDTPAQATAPAAPTPVAPPSEVLPITPEASIISQPALAESPQAAAPPASADEYAASRAEPAEVIAAPIAAEPEARGFEPVLEVEVTPSAVVEPIGVAEADLSAGDETGTLLATAAALEVLDASDAPSDELADLAVVGSTVVVVEDAEPAFGSNTSDQGGALAAEEATASEPVEEAAAEKRQEAPPQEA
jgi:hypothetical protein